MLLNLELYMFVGALIFALISNEIKSNPASDPAEEMEDRERLADPTMLLMIILFGPILFVYYGLEFLALEAKSLWL